ncbi:hypothetical protein LJC29_03755 [Bacteroides sp. OttesenSCG-928-N06]|nr:hypothetical protein [Bacteroides sp. OttesenSCG-928-N06]
MKKKYLLFALALGVLASCDPYKDEADFNAIAVASDKLLEGATFEQLAIVKNEDGTTGYTPAANGNYIKYDIHLAPAVSISYVKADGTEAILSTGAAGGIFPLIPKRGSDPTQTVYFRVLNTDGTVVEATKDFTVYVPTALEPEILLLASDAYGHKVWKWDVEWREDGGAWGNMGYAPGDGDSFVNSGNGIWWGCPPADLSGQLNHSDTGLAIGEEDPNAYMEITDEGKINTFDAEGKLIRSGTYSVEGWTGNRDYATIDGSVANWSYGTLKTTAGSILFPFAINTGGEKPTDFEILQLDATYLKLVYAKPNTGGWGEATWWAFKSISDPEGAITGYGKKDWTWDIDWREDGGAWGNMGYAPGDGNSFATSGNGIWWGCPPADLSGQLNHSDTGAATGEEDPAAYMTFSADDGTVETFAADGTKIRGGKFEIKNWGMGKRTQATVDPDASQKEWAYGTLNTEAGSILFPFAINTGGEKPTDFEIMQLDGDHMKLIYAKPGTGGWGEATWWAFKKK